MTHMCVCACHLFFDCRALCYLKVERFAEAKQDCDAALKLEPTNKKAFYRRAMANKGLKVNGALMTHTRGKNLHLWEGNLKVKAAFCLCITQDYVACSADLQEVLRQDPNVQEAEKELEEVTVLLRQSLATASPSKSRKTVPITEV